MAHRNLKSRTPEDWASYWRVDATCNKLIEVWWRKMGYVDRVASVIVALILLRQAKAFIEKDFNESPDATYYHPQPEDEFELWQKLTSVNPNKVEGVYAKVQAMRACLPAATPDEHFRGAMEAMRIAWAPVYDLIREQRHGAE